MKCLTIDICCKSNCDKNVNDSIQCMHVATTAVTIEKMGVKYDFSCCYCNMVVGRYVDSLLFV